MDESRQISECLLVSAEKSLQDVCQTVFYSLLDSDVEPLIIETIAESCQMLIYRFSERVHDTSWWLLPGEARSRLFDKA